MRSTHVIRAIHAAAAIVRPKQGIQQSVVRRRGAKLPAGLAVVLLLVVVALVAAAPPAGAGPFALAPPQNISIPSPFPPSCGGATEGNFPGANLNFENAEVEPWLAVSPTNPNDVAGSWQQDRWSDGGAHGLVAVVSHDGGTTWTHSWPHFSICAGGTAANGGDYGRSSDPWQSFAPNGDLWMISLSVDRTTTRNAVLVSKLAHGSSTWTEPTTVRFDSSRAGIPLGNNFNDKESLTADPTDPDSNLVYAVWDRNVGPSENVPASGFENSHAFHAPTWFARTTEGASANPKWEEAHAIYDPGTHGGTIANQIAVLPNGTLVDGFMQFQSSNSHDLRGASIRVISSTDKGVTWSKRATVVAPVGAIGETDPEPINCRPYISGSPLCTLVRSDGVIIDLAVDNSAAHHGRLYVAWQDHADNPHGDDLIMLSHSDDGGGTWSAPQKVNQTPSGTFTDQAFEPTLAVNDQGVVAVSYYDFREDVSGDGQLTTDHWVVHSHDGGASWTENRLAGPFDLHQAPYARGYFVGDYQGLEAQGSVFRGLFTVANPGAPGVFPNSNATDELTTTSS